MKALLVALAAVVLVGATASATTPAGDGEPGASPSPSAPEILARVARTYARCQSYRDTGVTTSASCTAGAAPTRVLTSSTAFIRPGRFRFEYVETMPRRGSTYIIWRGDDGLPTWWDVAGGQRTPESLGRAVAGATGVSMGASHVVSALLLSEEIGGRRMTDIAQPRRLDDASIDGVNCFRVEGWIGASRATLWIDQDASLLRRIERRSWVGGACLETAIALSPVLNERVDPDLLAFR